MKFSNLIIIWRVYSRLILPINKKGNICGFTDWGGGQNWQQFVFSAKCNPVSSSKNYYATGFVWLKTDSCGKN